MTFALASVVEPVMDGGEAVVVSVFGTDTVGLGPELVDADAEASSMLILVVSSVGLRLELVDANGKASSMLTLVVNHSQVV